MNEVQINKIKKRADEYATSCFPYEKQFLEREAVVKCCVHVVTETIAELEAQIEKMKSDVTTNIKWADQNKNGQMYCKLNAMFNQWEIKEK